MKASELEHEQFMARHHGTWAIHTIEGIATHGYEYKGKFFLINGRVFDLEFLTEKEKKDD